MDNRGDDPHMHDSFPGVEARLRAHERLIAVLNARIEEVALEMNKYIGLHTDYHRQLAEKTDALFDKVDVRADGLERRIGELAQTTLASFKQFEVYQLQFERKVDARFDEVDERFNQVDTHFEQIEAHMATKADLAQTNTRLDNVASDMLGSFELTSKELLRIERKFETHFNVVDIRLAGIEGKMATRDDLAEMRAEMATKADIANMATKADLVAIRAEMATKDDIVAIRAEMATKADLVALEARMATKDDLVALEARMATKDDLVAVRGEIAAVQADLVAVRTDMGAMESRILDAIQQVAGSRRARTPRQK